jgi:hypothetical protein
MGAHAAGELEPLLLLLRLLPGAWGAAVRQQFLAGPLSCLDLRRVGIDARRLDGEHNYAAGAALRVGEVREPVRAHAGRIRNRIIRA